MRHMNEKWVGAQEVRKCVHRTSCAPKFNEMLALLMEFEVGDKAHSDSPAEKLPAAMSEGCTQRRQHSRALA